jgi:hypothetical protein
MVPPRSRYLGYGVGTMDMKEIILQLEGPEYENYKGEQ